MIEDFIVKYMWSACGYCLISIPVFFGAARRKVIGEDTLKTAGTRNDGDKVAQRTEDYISNRRLLLALADAGGRLMYSWKDLAELAGYTSRVYSLLSTLHDLDASKYQSTPRPAELPASEPFYDLGTINGKLVIEPLQGFEDEEGVAFDKVPIVAPAPGMARGGEELVKKLSCKIKKGEHLLITGPNGCGKTSVARVIGVSTCASSLSKSYQADASIYSRTVAGIRGRRAQTRGQGHHVLTAEAVLERRQPT